MFLSPPFRSTQTPKGSGSRYSLQLNTILTHLATALLLSGCSARTAADRDGSPDMGTAEDTALVFTPETIDLGESKKHEFRFPFSIRNRSDSPIRIVELNKSCGCAMVNMPLPYEVPAGGTLQTVLEFAYAASSRGVIAQHIQLRTNDPRHPIYQIPITGILEGRPKVRLQPEIVHFGTVGSWETPTHEVRIRYGSRTDLEVQSVTPSDPQLTAVLDRKEPDGTVVYCVRLEKGFRLGLFGEHIEFATNYGNASLGVEGDKKGEIYTSPAFLLCHRKQFPAKRTLVLYHAPEFSPKVTSITSDAVRVSLESSSHEQSGGTRVILNLKAKKSATPEEGTVRMILKGREKPLSVKIYLSEYGRSRRSCP